MKVNRKKTEVMVTGKDRSEINIQLEGVTLRKKSKVFKIPQYLVPKNFKDPGRSSTVKCRTLCYRIVPGKCVLYGELLLL